MTTHGRGGDLTGCTKDGAQGAPTNDQANFTLLVIVAAGHHGPHCVVHHSHNVSVIVLGTNEESVTISSHLGAEIPTSEISLAGMLQFSHATKLVGGAGFAAARTQLTGLESSDCVMETARSP